MYLGLGWESWPWNSRKQTTVLWQLQLLLQMRRLLAATGELFWFSKLWRTLYCSLEHLVSPYDPYNGNAVVFSSVADGDFRLRSWRLGAKYFPAREVVVERTEVIMRYCGRGSMAGDGLTKRLAIRKYLSLVTGELLLWRMNGLSITKTRSRGGIRLCCILEYWVYY